MGIYDRFFFSLTLSSLDYFCGDGIVLYLDGRSGFKSVYDKMM